MIGTSRAGEWPLEITDPASHAAFARRLEGRAVDLVVCNAGIYLDKGEALTDGYTAPLWADTFAVNVMGVFLTVQSLLANLKASGAGRIAILSSTMASTERAAGGSYIYRASKAAALNLGRNLAADLRQDGIAVGIYHPGWVITDMGGAHADIGVSEAASGLVERFDALDMRTTGVFENWDGRPHAY